MACYHPLHALAGSVDTVTGKRKIQILSAFDPAYNRPDHIELPCGRCVGCKLDRSREWANRCMLELKYHDSAYFVTLTYNDAHAPTAYYVDDGTGECFTSLTLRKRDFQLFMKRLRKAFPEDKIRYFAAGEYGEHTMRPHYHAIIFGLRLDDLVPYQRSEKGDWYYKSQSLQRVWSVRVKDDEDEEESEDCVTPLADDDSDEDKPKYVPIGDIIVARVTWETCAYTARYCLKKFNGADAEVYEKFSLEPPFNLMSRRPGIGGQYYEDHPDYSDYQYISVSSETGGRKFTAPRYFDRRLERDNPEKLAELKTVREEIAKNSQRIKVSHTTLRPEDYLEVEEKIKKSSIKVLVRKV